MKPDDERSSPPGVWGGPAVGRPGRRRAERRGISAGQARVRIPPPDTRISVLHTGLFLHYTNGMTMSATASELKACRQAISRARDDECMYQRAADNAPDNGVRHFNQQRADWAGEKAATYESWLEAQLQ